MIVVTLERAIEHIDHEPDIDIILGTAHFDRGRVFELLPKAKAAQPGVPFVCCRVLDTPLHGMALEAMRTSCESHGAAGFIDLVELEAQFDQDEAEHQFRKLLLTQLRPLPGGRSRPSLKPV
jgi:hypothetical protein